MIKGKIKGANGISMISLVLTIMVLVIVTNVVIYNVNDTVKVEKLKKMQSDIGNLRDRVSSYYAQNGKIPANIEYKNLEKIREAGVISDVADTGRFLVIDLASLENLTLNYGKDYKKVKENTENIENYQDLYIINENSHNIFYVEGIKMDGDMFYTDYTADAVDSKAVDLRYVDNVKIPTGFYYVDGTKDTGIVISDEQGDDLNNQKQGNQFVWVPVESEQDFKRIEGYVNEQKQTYLANCEEPYKNGYATETVEYEEMLQSVKKNHGFYIGRFEVGRENNQAVVKKNIAAYTGIKWGTTMANVTGGAVEVAKNFASNQAYTDVISTLCYGIQWDATMRFLDPTYGQEVSNQSYVANSTEQGNYANNIAITGSDEKYAVKNIYDMAGNVAEWTMEAYGTGERITRGGDYLNGSDASASGRVGRNPAYASENLGFRITLYLKEEESWTATYDKEGIYHDKNGDTAWIPQGFQVSKTPGSNQIEEGLVAQDTAGNRYVWVEVPKTIYHSATFSEDYTNIEKDMQAYTEEYRQDGFTDIWKTKEQHGFQTADAYNSLKNKMLKSVYEHGGFWIGQYEMGTEEVRTGTSNLLTTAVCKEGAYPYNYVTCQQAQELVTNIDSGENTTSLMFGIQWDLVLKYMETKGAKTKEQLKTDSTEWGNYSNTSFDLIKGKYMASTDTNFVPVNKIYNKSANSILLTAGATNRNAVLNIYDFAGNLAEWTLEYTGDPNSPCAGRGGFYEDTGNTYPAVYRFLNGVTSTYQVGGFRVTLY